jgi:5-methyltetrahydrofolate--homocysteine methyltransferase
VIERFVFPRQAEGPQLCLADYFAAESGQPAIVAFQVVTMGEAASNETGRMQAEAEYTESYFLHGLSVQMAEAMADYVNEQVRRDLQLSGDMGRRYSWGYAAIPDLADHEKVFALLGVPEAIGVTLTESYQLVPEQSTAAIVVPHPDTVYFAVRA